MGGDYLEYGSQPLPVYLAVEAGKNILVEIDIINDLYIAQRYKEFDLRRLVEGNMCAIKPDLNDQWVLSCGSAVIRVSRWCNKDRCWSEPIRIDYAMP